MHESWNSGKEQRAKNQKQAIKFHVISKKVRMNISDCLSLLLHIRSAVGITPFIQQNAPHIYFIQYAPLLAQLH
jgi:hypothetical protein